MNHHAMYNAEGNDLHVEQLGANDVACAKGEVPEGTGVAYLSTASDFEIREDGLAPYTRRGDLLEFSRTP